MGKPDTFDYRSDTPDEDAAYNRGWWNGYSVGHKAGRAGMPDLVAEAVDHAMAATETIRNEQRAFVAVAMYDGPDRRVKDDPHVPQWEERRVRHVHAWIDPDKTETFCRWCGDIRKAVS